MKPQALQEEHSEEPEPVRNKKKKRNKKRKIEEPQASLSPRPINAIYMSAYECLFRGI